jgi:hypothetical protein
MGLCIRPARFPQGYAVYCPSHLLKAPQKEQHNLQPATGASRIPVLVDLRWLSEAEMSMSIHESPADEFT